MKREATDHRSAFRRKVPHNEQAVRVSSAARASVKPDVIAALPVLRLLTAVVLTHLPVATGLLWPTAHLADRVLAGPASTLIDLRGPSNVVADIDCVHIDVGAAGIR
jgi:hypothetical protein